MWFIINIGTSIPNPAAAWRGIPAVLRRTARTGVASIRRVKSVIPGCLIPTCTACFNCPARVPSIVNIRASGPATLWRGGHHVRAMASQLSVMSGC